MHMGSRKRSWKGVLREMKREDERVREARRFSDAE